MKTMNDNEEVTLYVRFNGTITATRKQLREYFKNGNTEVAKHFELNPFNYGYVCESDCNDEEFQGYEFDIPC